jgi:cyclic pyranopterin phosphate synthase
MPEEGIPLRPKSHFMRTEEVLQMAETFVEMGVKKIRITGGEPLVRKDAEQVIRGLSKLPVELAITTNGILVDRFIPVFKEVGLKAINVSLDTLDRKRMEHITRRDYYGRIMSNIELLLKDDFHVKVNVVLMRGTNDDEIIDFVNWTKDRDVHVRFIEFMPFDGNSWKSDKGVGFDEIISKVDLCFGKENLQRIQDAPNDTARNFRISGYKGTFAVIASVTNPFCDSCNRIRLTADGKIKNCLFSNSETDLLTAFREGQDIRPMIIDSVMHKKSVRAGMVSYEDLADPDKHTRNRSMISIGG